MAQQTVSPTAEEDEMTRFDIPQTVQDVLTAATEQNVIDAMTVYALANNYGIDWDSLVNEICEIAFTLHHVDRNKHAEVVKAAEAHWQATADYSGIMGTGN